MKKTYQIEVDCANCANLMENAAKKTDGVRNGQEPKAVMQAVLKACKKVEPDCEIAL